jgi:hypothetical protein
MYAPRTKNVPMPGPPKETWNSVEDDITMEIEDHTRPPISHEVVEETIISLCYFHPDGTDPVSRPVWAGQEVGECSRFSGRGLTQPADRV